jgi:hypothetical protein
MVVGGGSMSSSGGGEPSASCSADGSGRTSSVSTKLLRMDAELCRLIGAGDTGCWEDVDGLGCSSSSPSTTSTARSFPFLLLGVTEASAVRPSSVAPSESAREIRLQLFLGVWVTSECAAAPCTGPEEPLDFPTRPTMLLRIVDLRERVGRSDDATASPPRDGVEAVGNRADGPALEGVLEALEVFCFDVVCPI